MTKPKSGLCARVKSWWQATRWTASATLRSMLNMSIERYPEIWREGKLADLTSENLVPELVKATQEFDAIKCGRATPAKINEAIEFARASLEESKKQTEYQDDKASRLLTVTSFVSALSGALLAGFSSRYPLGTLNPYDDKMHIVLISAYFSFLLFIVFALCGALVTFHAIRTRFKYTSDEFVSDESRSPKSMLFYKGIISTGPKGWAESFITGRPDGSKVIRNDLKIVYLKNYVIESYLVAAKTAEKLRYLGPAQALLAWAMRFLIIFVLFLSASVALVPATAPKSQPIKLLMQLNAQPIPVKTVTPKKPAAEPKAKTQVGGSK